MERKAHVEMSPQELSLERAALELELGSLEKHTADYAYVKRCLGMVAYEISCRIEIGEMLPVLASDKET